MSHSVNKVLLLGNVGDDPKITTLNSGDKAATFSIATSEKWKDKNTGENRERTQWHRIVVYNQGLVKVIEGYVKKGSKIHLEGQLETRKYQDQSGADRYATEVVLRPYAGDVVLCGAPSGGRGAPDPDAYGSTRSVGSGSGSSGGGGAGAGAGHRPTDFDDDIPF